MYSKKIYPSYSKVGCIQCKKAHRKCNEKTPKCERCLRKSLDCKYSSNFILDTKGDLDKNKNMQSIIKKTRFLAFIPQTTNKSLSGDKIKALTNDINERKKIRAFSKHSQNSNVQNKGQSKENNLEFISYIQNASNEIKNDSNDGKKINKFNLDLNNELSKTSPIMGINDDPSNIINQESHLENNQLPIENTIFQQEIVTPVTPVGEGMKNESTENEYLMKKIKLQDYLMPSLTLEELIPITSTDLDFLNMIDTDGENFYSLNDTYIPYPYAFQVSWKSSVTVDFTRIFQRSDPIQNIYAETGDVFLKDIRLLNFIWTLNRGTRYYFNFPMFPLEIYDQVLGYCSKLNEIYSIVQSVMTYDCAMLMTGIYNTLNQKELFHLWDMHVRIPSFKQCLDILKERIEIVSSFSESVVLTFAVIIIFSANGSDKIWRTHLKGSYQLFLKSVTLYSKIDLSNEYDQCAKKLFEILQEWFFNIEFCCQVTSNTGTQIENSLSLKKIGNIETNDNIVILSNGLTLIGGHSQELKPIMIRIRNVLLDFENRGTNLYGNNFLLFKLTNTDKSLTTELKSIGLELSFELQAIKYNHTIKETNDYEMKFTLKNNDKLTRLALELYLEYFFVGNKTVEFFIDLLERILEVVYSMPYYYVVSLNWPLYQSALVALLSKEEKLFKCFYDVIYSLRQNGIYVVDNALNRLDYIKTVIESKDYDKLVCPEMDFMLI